LSEDISEFLNVAEEELQMLSEDAFDYGLELELGLEGIIHHSLHVLVDVLSLHATRLGLEVSSRIFENLRALFLLRFKVVFDYFLFLLQNDLFIDPIASQNFLIDHLVAIDGVQNAAVEAAINMKLPRKYLLLLIQYEWLILGGMFLP